MKKRGVLLSVFWPYLVVLCCLLLVGLAGSQIVTVVSENAPLKQRKCIVIDAGHGGEDGGAVSRTGAYESNINLEISLRLNDLLHLLGVDTVILRTSDISIYTQGKSLAAKKVSDLKQRVKLVNSTENATLISIHQNKFAESQYSGAQVFYAKTQGSHQLAKLLQASLVQTVNPGSKRVAKEASGVYLMRNVSCPAVLIECGFLSNPTEEAKLRDPDYQKKLCSVIGAVCSSYLHQASA